MAGAWCRQAEAALAAMAALGWLAACPLLAQEAANPQALLASTQAVALGSGSGVSCSNLNAYVTYFIADGASAAPEAIIIVHPNPAEVKSGALEALAERFVRVYQLTGYRKAVAQDGSAAFLFREKQPGPVPGKGQQAMQTLARGEGVVHALRWLNDSLGGAPHRVERSRLVWRKLIDTGRGPCELEVALSLLQGTPCHVDLRLPGIKMPAVAETLSEQLKLTLRPVADNRSALLRKQLGEKPLGYMAGDKTHGGLALVRVAGQSGAYRLGGVKPLAALRGKRGQEVAAATLPELPRALWPDERVSTPQPAPVAPSPAEPKAKPAAAPMPSPVEAREAYAKRLRAL